MTWFSLPLRSTQHSCKTLGDRGVFPTTVEDDGAVGGLLSIFGGSEHEFETLLAALEDTEMFVQNGHVV